MIKIRKKKTDHEDVEKELSRAERQLLEMASRVRTLEIRAGIYNPRERGGDVAPGS